MPQTHEHTLNVALGEVLQERRRHSWRVHAEETRSLQGSGKRADILIEEASQWPVVIEAEKSNHDSAEQDALARLGEIVNETGRRIESAIALVYPVELHELSGPALRQAINTTDAFEYALLTQTISGGVERLPESGWLRGSLIDLAMLAQRASMPAPRVERLGQILEDGINAAAGRFTSQHGSHAADSLGAQVAALLGQADDPGGQTRRMAMTVLINALIFHSALAEAEFRVSNTPSPHLNGDPADTRRVRPLSEFRVDLFTYRKSDLLQEWELILERNYWPIFATAKEMLNLLPLPTMSEVLNALWDATEQLVQGGITKSHDLTGVIFQRLIADRKFLATFYTRPAAAALLAGLAIPAERAPGGAEWGDEDSIASLQIGDFACGTGTLLAAAYQRISLLHELNGGDPRALHAPMMRNGLVGLDVLNIAVHLTAALAGAHPDVPFDGECLLTMPYGGESASIGSLELLAEHVAPDMIDQAAAITAGGRKPEDVRDLVSRVGHNKFDLVIMNPPFTRQGGQEGERVGVGNAAFAAFETSRQTQDEMQKQLRRVSGKVRLGSGNAGAASHFVDLANRKLNGDGTIAFVLPLSAVSGSSWTRVRKRLREHYRHICVITIAAAGSFERSFSADTGMAECLIVASKGRSESQASFVVLDRQPTSALEGSLIAKEILGKLDSGLVDQLKQGATGGTSIHIGDSHIATIVNASLTDDDVWPLSGISDIELAQVALRLQMSRLELIGRPLSDAIHVPISSLGAISTVGPYHLDIRADRQDGSPRGPFQLISPPESTVPTYPILWAHDAKRERTLIVSPDSEGRIKKWPETQSAVDAKAARIWNTASRLHYAGDLQFNSQSLVVSTTERKSIGGLAWPSIILQEPGHERALALWCNSTLGVLCHWWVTNKSQAGRGRVSVTGIPNIPTLDTRALSDAQHAEAKRQFDLLREERFLPFDQIDEDPARAKLDRAILVDVLGLPESLVAPDGPIDLIRRKLAREPQIHGGKQSRVVFTDDGEQSVKRADRG